MRNFLKDIRKRKGLTLEQLSEASGFAVPTINNFELEKTEVSDRFLEKMAQALNVRIQDITGGPRPADLRESSSSVVELVLELGASLQEVKSALIKSEDIYRRIDQALRGPNSINQDLEDAIRAAQLAEEIVDRDLESQLSPKAASTSGKRSSQQTGISQRSNDKKATPKRAPNEGDG